MSVAPHFVYDTNQILHEPYYLYARKELREKSRCLLKRRWEQKIDEYRNTSETDCKSGDEVLADLRWWLDNLGVTRHEYQIQFHEEFIKSCLPKIYQLEWEADYDRILKQFNVVKLKQETLVVCPRRFGKTYSVALFCAAFIWCVPNGTTAIFSTCQRTAHKLMALMLRFMIRIPQLKDKILKKNAEEIIIERNPGNLSTVNCYPGTVKVCSFLYLTFFFSLLLLLVTWISFVLVILLVLLACVCVCVCVCLVDYHFLFLFPLPLF